MRRFERAIALRNAVSAGSLRPGLSWYKAESQLRQAEITGDTAALTSLYSWKNGENPESKTSLLPHLNYKFLDLEDAIRHYRTLQEAAGTLAEIGRDPLGMSERLRDYFPIFWDGATGYFVMGLASHGNPVALLELESEQPLRVVFRSFDVFLVDAIRANERDEELCVRD